MHLYTFSKGKVKTPSVDQVILQLKKEKRNKLNVQHGEKND